MFEIYNKKNNNKGFERRKNMNKVYILSGLPGSGKTYFAERMKEIYRENGDNLFVYHQDDKNSQWWKFQSFSDIIMDCLNLTNEEIIKCIKEVLKHIQLEQYHEFIIIRWKENREKCIKNDNGRREINSEKTIKHAIFEKPNLKQIKVETGITNLKLEEREIVEKNEKLLEFNQKYHVLGGYLKSGEWLIYGTSRGSDSNYNNVYTSMDPDDAKEFDELDNYLTEVCPNISFLDYKYIRKNFVKIITYETHDYYSNTTESYYQCDMEQLEKFLIKHGYV